MSEIVLKNIRKNYDDRTVIENLNLNIKSGSFCVFVGSSGCGKTTILRMIAGLEEVTEGEIYIDNILINKIDSGDRNIAMVFQNYALYPTMTVKENIEFGLINAKIKKSEREKLIQEVVDIVGLQKYLDKKPAQLSGGQRQRVALARAMVKKPKVFLMDEPLSNLDAKLRSKMRSELIQLHHKIGATFIYVTYDQVEALSMATDIVLLNEGRIMQQGSPLKIYSAPQNIYTTQFIGSPEMNIVKKEKYEKFYTCPDKVKYIGFRPSKIHIGESNEKNKIVVNAVVLTRELLGSEIIYKVDSDLGKLAIKAFNSKRNLEIDDRIKINIEFTDIHHFNEKGSAILKEGI